MTGPPPKVFISYSHDTIAHQEGVLDLADRLRADGINAEIDQYNDSPPEGWPRWCERQIEAADVVLMVCTETYHRRVRGEEAPGKGLGVVWEAAIIHQLLYDAGVVSNKVVPVLFSDGSPDHIPTPIKGWNRYVADTEDGYEGLYRRLSGQPPIPRPALGAIRALAPRARRWSEGTREAASSSLYPAEESGTMDPVNAIGVDVGTTKIAAGLVAIPRNGSPTVTNYERVNHDDIGRKAQLLDKIADVVRSVMNAAGMGKRDLPYIGVGLPGQVSYDAGLLTLAPGLKLRDISVAGELRRILEIPIFIDNDVNCSTLAELHFGNAGKLYNHFVCIFIGTGIGAGIVIDKHIYRGGRSAAGELGHMKIDCSENARACTCGKKGCFEEYASARAIIRLARERIFEIHERKQRSVLKDFSAEKVRPEDIVVAIKSGDEISLALAKRIASYLGTGIANVLNILNPQAVVLGGGIIDGFYCGSDFFRNAVSEGIKNAVLDVCGNTEMMTSSWAQDTPIIGAAVMGNIRQRDLLRAHGQGAAEKEDTR